MGSLHSAQAPVAWLETNCTQTTWANDVKTLPNVGIGCDCSPDPASVHIEKRLSHDFQAAWSSNKGHRNRTT